MGKTTKVIILASMPVALIAQQQILLGSGAMEKRRIDSIRHAVYQTGHDSTKYQAAISLCSYFQSKNIDSAILYGNIANELGRNNEKWLAVAAAFMQTSFFKQLKGDFSGAYRDLMTAIDIAENPENENTHFISPLGGKSRNQRLELLAILHAGYGHLLKNANNSRESIRQYEITHELFDQIQSYHVIHQLYMHIGDAYRNIGMKDSALYYANLAESKSKELKLKYHNSYLLTSKASILMDMGNMNDAIEAFREAERSAMEEQNMNGLIGSYSGLSKSYQMAKEKDSALFYARKAMQSTIQFGLLSEKSFLSGQIYGNLYQAFLLNGEKDSAFRYLEMARKTETNFHEDYINSLSGFQNLLYEDKLKLQQLEREKIQTRNRIRTGILSAGLGLVVLCSIVFYLVMRQKQKANTALTKAYVDLKDTQQHLIQSEKMASLGELTAGIAHEIQNPLNFVNNFSDVNKDLIDEMKSELANGHLKEAESIADTLRENQEKISLHGNRADAIVKGMLQHSRAGTGRKELTDINALTSEYLKLSYHGLRARDDTFNPTLQTEFDPAIGKMNIVPQEIGRVIINLVNNAFYAVKEKQKLNISGYEPTVIVTTKKLSQKIEIKVTDNGDGIPSNIADKIFQPFFTTKPTGQGTGLGLSLSYDIITKEHGGELKVEIPMEGGAIFIIQLPANT